MQLSLSDLACLVDGQLTGDRNTPITGAATLADVVAGDITFIDSAEKLPQLKASAANAAVVPPGVDCGSLPVISVSDVYAAFARIVEQFRPRRMSRRTGISTRAFVSPTAKLAADVDVHPGASIGDEVEIGPGCTIHSGACIMAGCKLGRNVTVYANAVLYEETRVGDRAVIHAAAVIGADGFGYKFVEGRHRLAAQLGNVEIGADVEVGAGATIDRGAYGPTRIGEGTKIDDQVMIAHNCQIGRHNLICSQVGIAGSTSTGDYVVMAGQVGVRDHVHIGDRAVLGAMSGIISDVPADSCLLGVPATPEKVQWLQQAAIAKLPEMRKELKRLERAVAELKQRLGDEKKSAA
jgi:UDP-3-O-[3-hydroxymyristoyl] glucosamine N-acyltransferase